MSWLAENALMIWAIGALALTMALVVYFQTGTRQARYGVLAVVLLTALLLILESVLETPSEAVARTIEEIMTEARDNDMPGVMSYISPSAAGLRKEVETAMPQVTIETANIVGTPVINVDMSRAPHEATVTARGFVHATVKRSGMKGGDIAELTISLVDGVVGKQIACQLFEQKPVKRHVRIDGVDHPVPVAPGFAKKKVFIEAVRIGVSRQIQPVPPPPPAEFW